MNDEAGVPGRHAALSGASDIMSCFRGHVDRQPDKVFVRCEIPGGAEVVTYAAACHQIEQCRREYERLHVRGGSVVLLFLPQSWTAIAYFLGAIAHGCTASFMPCPSAKQEPGKYWSAHRALIDRIRPGALVSDATHATAIEANGLVAGDTALILAAHPLPGDDAADAPGPWQRITPTPVLQHSSGTTGLKKGVMLSHRAILAQVEAYASSLQARPDDVIVSWLPLYHDMGLVACLLMPMLLGQSIVLLDPFHWIARPATLLEAISRHRGNLCWLPNFAFEHLTRLARIEPASTRLDSVRAFINCSEPCHAATFLGFAQKFAPAGLATTALQVCYAMAETTFAVTQTPSGSHAMTLSVDRTALSGSGIACTPKTPGEQLDLISAGRPIPGTEVFILDEVGNFLGDDSVGEIHVRSTSLFSGYYNLPEETAQRLSGDLYATRDRGFTHDGELFVLGRLDDLIIVAGRNFHATQIESIVNGIPGAKPGRAIAFGVPNASRGTADLIIVAETEGDLNGMETARRSALRRSIREAVFQAQNAYPAEVALVPPGWLQKTTSGKIERHANVERYLRERAADGNEGRNQDV